MTVLEARENLINWFLEHEVFDPIEDFPNILEKISLTRDLEKATYEAALAQLVEASICAKVDVKGKTAWVLMKPLFMQTQTIELNFILVKAIVETINLHSKFLDGQTADSFNVGPNEIIGLLSIIGALGQILSENEKENEDEST